MTDHIKKKRILFVRTAMGQGGADRVTLNLLRHLDRNEYSICLLVMKREGEYLSFIPPDVDIFFSKASSLWSFMPYLIRTIKLSKSDVVFSIDGGANIPLAISSFLQPRRKWKAIVSERNVVFPPGKNKIKRRLMVWLKAAFYPYTDQITAVSHGVQQDISKWLSIAEHKIRIVDNPLVEAKMLEQALKPVSHQWFTDNREVPVVVHAGRFVHQKDHITLIKAFKKVKARFPCRLFLLGDGPLLDGTKKLVADLDIKDVYFAGFDINPFRYFSKCDVFVLSSIHEGMPGVLIQAMACGAPVISTNCPFGPAEIIGQSGVNGLLVPVQDPESLSKAIIAVLKDKDLSLTLRKMGPKAVEKFKIDKAIVTYIDAIES